MTVSSFDIFDTCLVRKCGTPENFFDVFSLQAFNSEVEEWARQEFVAARHLAQKSVQAPSMTLQDIWEAFDWRHPQLKSKDELFLIEQQVEREMLVPVLSMRDKVNASRENGHHILFISDMYLPSSFLCEVMQATGFMQDGDGLYVSCECSAEKWNGALFKYVHDKENLSYRQWHHYGDSEAADYRAPRKLGIKSTRISHPYTPYQHQWMMTDYSLGYKFPSIMAGLGRAIHYSTEWTTHTDFVLDIIAPYYCSLVCRILRNARERGMQRLYFCARDAYPMYRIALQYKSMFPDVACNYLYISRQSLYEGDDNAKLQYFIQEGVATQSDNVAIVDVRSQGKTQRFLSDYLMEKGYKEVYGYYFEMFTLKEQKFFNPYYCEANGAYLTLNHNLHQLLLFRWQLYEDFFSLNDFPKTIDYEIDNEGNASPVFSYDTDFEDSMNQQQSYWTKVHNSILENYASEYVRLGLTNYSDDIFAHVTLPTLNSFMERPKKIYLEAITDFWSYRTDMKKYVPYVRRLSLWEMIVGKGNKNNMWSKASKIYSLPEWLSDVLLNVKEKIFAGMDVYAYYRKTGRFVKHLITNIRMFVSRVDSYIRRKWNLLFK